MHFVAPVLLSSREKPPTGHLRLTRAIVDTVIDTRIRLLPMKIQQLPAADAIASLNSSPGAVSAEALRRLHEYGLNRVEEVARESLVLRFLKEFTHFFALILWLAAALAFLAEWSDPGQGMAKIGYAILAVIVVSGLFSFWQEFRVERTLAALRELLPQQVEVLRDGKAVAAARGSTRAGRHRRVGARK